MKGILEGRFRICMCVCVCVVLLVYEYIILQHRCLLAIAVRKRSLAGKDKKGEYSACIHVLLCLCEHILA